MMTTMKLSQVVSRHIHVAEYTLDLVFCTEQDSGDLGVEKLLVVPLSWTHHYLVGVRLFGTLSLCRDRGAIKMVCPKKLMDPNGFLTLLGEFPAVPMDSL